MNDVDVCSAGIVQHGEGKGNCVSVNMSNVESDIRREHDGGLRLLSDMADMYNVHNVTGSEILCKELSVCDIISNNECQLGRVGRGRVSDFVTNT